MAKKSQWFKNRMKQRADGKRAPSRPAKKPKTIRKPKRKKK